MKPYRVTVHCSVTPNGRRTDIREITRDHIKRGFKTVGYHAVIQPDGEIQHGRGLNEEGAHVQGDNLGNIGICLIGDSLFTWAQFDALRRYLDDLHRTYDIQPWEIYCHYEFDSAKKQGKSCPNLRIGNLMTWYLSHYKGAIHKYILEVV